MKKTNSILALFAALAMVFTGCKDEDVPAFEYKTQGVIKGTLTGETSQGDDLEENFSFSQFAIGSSYYSSFENFEGEDFYSFAISRSDINNGGGVSLFFTLDELNSTEVIDPRSNFSFRKETNDKIIIFSLNDNGGGDNETKITNLSFDEKSGRVKGNFEISGDDNTSGENATITGEFDVVVKRAVQ